MKPSLLIVVDEKQMGGVSVLLEDLIKLNTFDDYETDILVLHNNGEMFKKLSPKVNIIYGSSYFRTVDLTIKEVIKTKKINLIFNKIRLVLEMKTGLIKNRIKRERKKILNKKYDVEIAFKDGFTALFTIFGDSVRKIHWLHYEYGNCNPNRRYNKLFQKYIPLFDEIVAVSNGVKDAFMKVYNVSNVKVIPNIIDKDKIINMSLDKPVIKKDTSKINLILVGRVHSVKGYDRFVDVLIKLRNDGLLSNFSITIVGDGPDMPNLKNQISDNNLDINLLGMINNPYKEIRNSDILVLPSKFEAFGLVALESLIIGVPVFATKTAAIDKIVDNGKNGLIVDNSFDGIYTGLVYLARNRNIIEKYKNNLSNFNYNINDKIEEIKNVLKGR